MSLTLNFSSLIYTLRSLRLCGEKIIQRRKANGHSTRILQYYSAGCKNKEKLGLDVFEVKYSTNSDTTWNDGSLWRDGCMDNSVLNDLLDGWEAQGFELTEEVGSQKYWKDVCVVNSSFGPSHPC